MQDFIYSHGVSLTTKEAFPSGMRHVPLGKKKYIYYSHLEFRDFTKAFQGNTNYASVCSRA